MTRKSILGVLALCALSLCAFGAANASAAGLTAVTCEEVEPGTGKYNTSECATPAVKGNFETKAITAAKTALTGSQVSEFSRLKATVALSKVEVTCTATMTDGKATNIEVGGEMRVEGIETVNEYSGCHASLEANTAKKCEVESVSGTAGIKGKIFTNSLKSMTGPEHKVTFEPTIKEGSFAKFKILKGECLGTTAEVNVTGSVIGIANTEKHHHLTFEPATNGANLKANGGPATYEGTYTTVMKETTKHVGLETF